MHVKDVGARDILVHESLERIAPSVTESLLFMQLQSGAHRWVVI